MSAEFSRVEVANWAQPPCTLSPKLVFVLGNMMRGIQRAKLWVRVSQLTINVCYGCRRGKRGVLTMYVTAPDLRHRGKTIAIKHLY